MRTATIGDIHGRSTWKAITPEEYDKIIFVGDYVDSFDVENSKMYNNLLDIIEFKRSNPDKVILLWGNHDLQYRFDYSEFGCSGFRLEMYPAFRKVFIDNDSLFTAAYQIGRTIWTHAGIHKGWLEHRFKYDNGDTLADKINNAFIDKDKTLFDVGRSRGGWHDVGGPFWCDKSELTKNPIDNYNQIVGHSRVKENVTVYPGALCVVTYTDSMTDDSIEIYEKEL